MVTHGKGFDKSCFVQWDVTNRVYPALLNDDLLRQATTSATESDEVHVFGKLIVGAFAGVDVFTHNVGFNDNALTNFESGQTIMKGMGELHLDILVDRMKREFKVEANVGKPQVAYRETIKRKVDKVDYTHKKQTGGSGQFAKVQLAFEPLTGTDEDGEAALYEFENAVTGGRVPREYIPSVDQGIQEAMQLGVLAGYPLVGIKATLLDGAYHDVDSSEMAFKIAGSMALKEAVRKANPVLLEPMMAVEVRTPEEYMGDVIGDINARRGTIQSMEDASGAKVVRGTVPLSEMFGYVGDLRSKTQGRANYSMQFDSYGEVPKNVAEEIVKKVRGE